MKKSTILVLLVTALMIGCASLPGYEKHQVNGKSITYFTGKQYFESLDGNFYVYSAQIYSYSSILLSYSGMIKIIKIVNENGQGFYAFQHEYAGEDWRFMEELKIKANGILYELKDNNPYRKVRLGGVKERLIHKLDRGMINKLKNAKVIRFQFYGEPVTLSKKQRLTL